MILKKRILTAIRNRPEVTLALTTLVVLAVVVLLLESYTSPFYEAINANCKTILGDEWEAAGYLNPPGIDHYDVRCERQIGLFRTESEWITVSRDSINVST